MERRSGILTHLEYKYAQLTDSHLDIQPNSYARDSTEKQNNTFRSKEQKFYTITKIEPDTE